MSVGKQLFEMPSDSGANARNTLECVRAVLEKNVLQIVGRRFHSVGRALVGPRLELHVFHFVQGRHLVENVRDLLIRKSPTR
jgi:hypothetical protein